VQERPVGKPGQLVVGGREVQMFLPLSELGLRLISSAQLRIFLPNHLLQAFSLGDVRGDASQRSNPSVAVVQRELVDDTGVQQPVRITNDFFDLDGYARLEHFGVVHSELRANLA